MYLTDSVTVAAGTISDFDVFDADAIADVDYEPTLVRLRGEVIIIANPASASVFNNAHGAMGIIELDDPGGVTEPVILSPIDDADGDWIWFQYWHVTGATVTTGLGLPYGPVERYEIDSKAMRKLEKNRSLVFAIENDAGSDMAIGYHAATRYLLKNS